ncbi:MAG TPA: ABC transporter ATP-binding protein [Candidatus Sulfotelmatobacter sp.]|nr:ABC transporter ATP-binding protein [Candidatus Sulfotelmatobacter sp.]
MLDVRAITKRYWTKGGPLVALDGVSLSLVRGEFLAIVGPSGCGKSTLLMGIAGLDAPSAGEVRVAGRLVAGAVTDVGIVFQRDVLLDWRNALDNVLLQVEMRRLRREDYLGRARHLMQMVKLAGFEDRYPFELSGGMRQRVAICRALIHDPPLLLMDEPFGALDALTREQMIVELHRIWQDTGKSVVFVTHDIREAVFLADRVLVMTPRPGRIAATVTVDLPRPRNLAMREGDGFSRCVGRIREIFEQYGVLEKA